jgi:Ankyrin repeats (3 copies)
MLLYIQLIFLIAISLPAGVYAENTETKRISNLINHYSKDTIFPSFNFNHIDKNNSVSTQSNKAAENLIFSLLLSKSNISIILKNKSIDLNTPVVIDSCELKNGFQNKDIVDAACATNISWLRAGATMTLTPLQATCLTGDLTSMKMLVKAGANVNSSFKELNPLISCLATKKFSQAAFLIDQGANVNFPTTAEVSRLSPLSMLSLVSTYNSDKIAEIKIAKMMINGGADVNYRAKDGSSELHMAAGVGNLDIVKLLVQEDVDINTKNKEGLTPLAEAEKYNRTEVVNYLISVGAQK